MFLFEPREKGLTENQDQRKERAIPSWLKPLNFHSFQAFFSSFHSKSTQSDWLKQAYVSTEEQTCRKAPTHKGTFPKACKFKTMFTHYTFLSLISTTISAIKAIVHQGVNVWLTKAFVLGVTDSEPLIAFTSVTSHCVYTTAILTDPRFGLTFILIYVFQMIWQNQVHYWINAG